MFVSTDNRKSSKCSTIIEAHHHWQRQWPRDLEKLCHWRNCGPTMHVQPSLRQCCGPFHWHCFGHFHWWEGRTDAVHVRRSRRWKRGSTGEESCVHVASAEYYDLSHHRHDEGSAGLHIHQAAGSQVPAWLCQNYCLKGLSHELGLAFDDMYG